MKGEFSEAESRKEVNDQAGEYNNQEGGSRYPHVVSQDRQGSWGE